MKEFDFISKPELIVDKRKGINNIKLMKAKADASNVIFRPHFKTHQSIEIGKWFREIGIDKITVSSLSMADYFSMDGWKDITVAFPVNLREIDLINKLADKIKLNLLVESIDSVKFLETKLKSTVNIYLKIDVGTNRTGIYFEDRNLIERLYKEISKSEKMNLEGLLSHAGHTYSADSRKEILNIYKTSVERLNKIRNYLKKDLLISYGDTPSCSVASEFKHIDEIRPGNFVFYDFMQLKLGVCNFENIAVVLAVPVVAKHYERMEIVVYGGAVHLSKDFVIVNNKKYYGGIVYLKNNSWSELQRNCFVKSISQEHGIIKVSKAFYDKIKIGDLIGIVPVHSCLTADLMKQYFTTEGEKITMFENLS